MCRLSNFEPKTEKFKNLVKYLKKYGNKDIGITLVFKIKKESDNKYLIDGEPIKKKHLVYFEDIKEDGFPEYRLHKSLDEIVNPLVLLPRGELKKENKVEKPSILLGGENKPKIAEVDPIIEDKEELSSGPLYIVDKCLEKFKTNELFIECYYNIYQYKGEIYVVRNYNYKIDRYGNYFINKVNKLLGL